MFNRRNNWTECVTVHRVAVQSARKAGDRLGEAQTAIALGEGHLNIDGPGEDALRYLRRATELLEPMGAISLRSVALNNLGEIYFALGDLDAAAECYVKARDICHEIGGYVEGHVLHNLGLVYLRLHRLDDAIASFTEALSKHRAAGLLAGEAWTLKDLAEARAETGDMAEARVSLTAATRIFEQVGDRASAAQTASLLASLTVKLAAGSLRRRRLGKAAPQTRIRVRSALIRAHAVCRLDFAGASNTQ